MLKYRSQDSRNTGGGLLRQRGKENTRLPTEAMFLSDYFFKHRILRVHPTLCSVVYHHHGSAYGPFLTSPLINGFINVFTFILIPLSHRQSVFIDSGCIFLLESVLAKCILSCIWVFKNFHTWCCAASFPGWRSPPGAVLLRSPRVVLCPSRVLVLRAAQDPRWCVPTSPTFPGRGTEAVLGSPP